MQNGKASTQGREMHLARLLNAPVDLVWEVMTDPGHVAQWWGPDGFTITVTKMEVKPGGQWNFTMHGPDGTRYENKIIYKEVVPRRRLVLEYYETSNHVTTVELEKRGEQTLMKWHIVVASEEQLIELVRNFNVDKALEQTVEKWSRYLETLQRGQDE